MKTPEVAKLQAYLRTWRAANPYRWQQGAQIVLTDLLQDAAFTDITLAEFVESPGGATITQVVESVLPFPGSAEAAVMVEAIEIAAKKQTDSQVVGVLVIGAIAALLLWAVFGDW